MFNKKRDFDSEKLEVFFEKEVVITEHTAMIGRVYSYDGDEPRVKLLMKTKQDSGKVRVENHFPPLKSYAAVVAVQQLLYECGEALNNTSRKGL